MAAVPTSPLQSVRLARLHRSRLKKKLNLLKFRASLIREAFLLLTLEDAK
jgi:hypothetical protein